MLVSIIIPVYNVERYLSKIFICLKEQTFKNLELIFVNDGSSDRSALYLERFKEYEVGKNIKIIHKENGGLSSARNTGLSQATGEYVFFIDSDDWIDSDYIENCVRYLEYDPVDILFTPYIREYKSNSMRNPLFDNDKIRFSKDDITKKILLRLYGPCENDEKSPTKLDNLNTAWAKMYKRNIIEGLRFESRDIIGTAEDLWFNINAFNRAQSAFYLGTEFLHYNKTNTDSLVSNYHPEMHYTRQNTFEIMNQFIKDYNLPENFTIALNNRIVLEIFSQILSLSYSTLDYSIKRKICREIVNDDRYRKSLETFDYKNMQNKWKIFYKMAETHKVDFMLAMVNAAVRLRETMRR